MSSVAFFMVIGHSTDTTYDQKRGGETGLYKVGCIPFRNVVKYVIGTFTRSYNPPRERNQQYVTANKNMNDVDPNTLQLPLLQEEVEHPHPLIDIANIIPCGRILLILFAVATSIYSQLQCSYTHNYKVPTCNCH